MKIITYEFGKKNDDGSYTYKNLGSLMLDELEVLAAACGGSCCIVTAPKGKFAQYTQAQEVIVKYEDNGRFEISVGEDISVARLFNSHSFDRANIALFKGLVYIIEVD